MVPAPTSVPPTIPVPRTTLTTPLVALRRQRTPFTRLLPAPGVGHPDTSHPDTVGLDGRG